MIRVLREAIAPRRNAVSPRSLPPSGGLLAVDGADEEGTHERLKAHIGQWLIRRSRSTGAGREKNTRRACASFRAATDEVRGCAVEVQREMAERNADVPVERRIELRRHQSGDVIARHYTDTRRGEFCGGAAGSARRARRESASVRVVRTGSATSPIRFRGHGRAAVRTLRRPVRV